MAENISRVKIRLMGKDYSVKADQPAHKIEAMAKELDATLTSLSKKYSHLSNTDIALLAAMSLMEEVNKLRDEKKELWELLGEATRKE